MYPNNIDLEDDILENILAFLWTVNGMDTKWKNKTGITSLLFAGYCFRYDYGYNED